MNNQYPRFSLVAENVSFQPRSARAFTLIEMLVVIAIIGILASLVLAGAGAAMAKSKLHRAQAEVQGMALLIEGYKAQKNVYPPDGVNGPIQTPLFYELTGMIQVQTNYNGRGSGLLSPIDQEFFSFAGGPPNLTTLNTLFGVGGIFNSSADQGDVKNFASGHTKKSQYLTVTNPSPTIGGTFTVFGVDIPGPVQLSDTSKNLITPFQYVSSNPTNNPTGGFDLWLDITIRGKTNRISNWSPDPKVL